MSEYSLPQTLKIDSIQTIGDLPKWFNCHRKIPRKFILPPETVECESTPDV